MTDSPFAPAPQSGVPDFLQPQPPPSVPEPQQAADATARLSPFTQPLDADAIIENLILDRPLKLFIPHRERYPDWEFRIINSIPQEIADAQNKGFRQVDDPEMTRLFTELVAGTDKEGKAFRPLLMARSKKVGDHIRAEHRRRLRSLYQGMDPRNKELAGKYTKPVDAQAGTFGDFSGAGWRIRV